MNFENVFYDSLKSISFSEKFKELVDKFSISNEYLSKTKNSEVKKIFEKLGVKIIFKDSSYFLIEEYGKFKFQITFQLKLGSVFCYFFVWFEDSLLQVEYGHLAFVRNKLDGMQEFIAPNFSSYEDLEKILGALLSIYEDFKSEFLRQVNEQEIV